MYSKQAQECAACVRQLGRRIQFARLFTNDVSSCGCQVPRQHLLPVNKHGYRDIAGGQHYTTMRHCEEKKNQLHLNNDLFSAIIYS
jgi:hypothetical protein